jgi:poly-gamma-glutamate synthesis protein (capsule biosynthesis protein)
MITLFLCGDVMPGRGIDQALPHPCDPRLHEGYVRDARDYVALAEAASGPIPRPVDFAYVWGDALAELERAAPQARLVNLETAVTTSDAFWPKGINYRMHPRNVPVLAAAGIDACALANNHVLDWGAQGLAETLATLRRAGIQTAGAGSDQAEAQAPAVLTAGQGRVLLFACGAGSSGIPAEWGATASRPGVNLLPELSPAAARRLGEQVRAARRPGDVAVVSIHWGGNWGYAVPKEERAFARLLVEEAGVDLVHGHSSHHPKGIEVHAGKLILYGCGDFLNDYEGISGYEAYRGELTLMYFPSLDPATGRLIRLRMAPLRVRRFRLQRAAPEEAVWLRDTLDREGRKLGSRVELNEDGRLELRWG